MQYSLISIRLRFLIVMTLIAALALPQPAILPIDLFTAEVNAHILAGIDEPTRLLIEQVPGNIKDQMLDFLIKAGPILQANLALGIDQVDGFIDRNLVKIQCTGAVLASEVPPVRFNFPFVRAPKDDPTTDLSPRDILNMHINHRQRMLTARSGPTEFANQYGSLTWFSWRAESCPAGIVVDSYAHTKKPR